MVRVLWITLLLVALAALTVFLADQPGELAMTWRGYEIRTSFVVGLLGLAVAAFLLVFLYRIVIGVIRSPEAVNRAMEKRRRKKGLAALSRGMVAVAAGDAREAKRYAAQAHALLDEPAMTLLVAAQAAQLEGDDQAATRYFTTMLEAPETEFLGLRGLYVQASRAGETKAAMAYAHRAIELKPKTEWASDAVFDLAVREGRWDEALATLKQARRAKLIDKGTEQRRRAVLLTALGLDIERGLDDELEEDRRLLRRKAIDAANEANALTSGFAPAAALAGRLLADDGQPRRAMKLLEKAWDGEPHPEIAEAYRWARRDETAYERLERVKAFAARKADHPESRIALARAAIDARDWVLARQSLKPLVEKSPTARVCALMADIEEGQSGNKGLAREWLARALSAPPDAQWVCDGYASDTWTPICPSTGTFDTLRWRVPSGTVPQTISGSRQPSRTLRGASPGRPPAPQGPAQASPAPPAASKAPDAGQADGPATVPALPAEAARPNPEANAAPDRRAAPRAPDDPGPCAPDDPETDAGLRGGRAPEKAGSW